MGNKLASESVPSEDSESVIPEESHDKIYDVDKIYWDPEGNLRYGRTDRNRDAEILKMLQVDSIDETDPSLVWMIIPTWWVRVWLTFAHLKLGPPPGPIDMFTLLQQDRKAPNEGWRARNTLIPPSSTFGEEHPGHYRRITPKAWNSLATLYGVDGYAIAVKGTPYDDRTRWRVFKDPLNIDESILPEPVIAAEEEKKEDTSKGGVAGAMAGALGSLFGGGSSQKPPAEEKNINKSGSASGTPTAAASTPKNKI